MITELNWTRFIRFGVVAFSACTFNSAIDESFDASLPKDASPDAQIVDAGPDAMAPDAAQPTATVSAPAQASPDDGFASVEPSAAWSRHGVCGFGFEDHRDGNGEVYFFRVDQDNAGIALNRRITNNLAASRSVAITPGIDEWGVVWTDTRGGDEDIWFSRVTSIGLGAGSKIGNDKPINTTIGASKHADITWSGSEWGVVYQDEGDNPEIYFARLAADGTLLGSEVRLTLHPADSIKPHVVWTGTNYMVVWSDNRDTDHEIYMATVDSAGSKSSVDIKLTNNAYDIEDPSIVWAGTEAGITWTDFRDGNKEIYIMSVNGSGVKRIPETRISAAEGDSVQSDVAFANGHYAISWVDSRSGAEQIYLSVMRTNTDLLLAERAVTSDAASSRLPSITGSGNHFCIAWFFNDTATTEIYTAVVELMAP
jgi:hypothetical protein